MNENIEAVRHYREMQERHEEPAPPSALPSGTLPLAEARLEVRAKGGRAQTMLVQRFENFERVPLAVTYKLPLPADAAVSGFAFVVGGVRSVGEVQRKKDARETYERAIARGHSAALLEQERPNLFVQELGNIPPGQSVEVEITLDQPLAWIAGSEHGAWEWRFPLAAAPRYLGATSDGPHLAVTEQLSRARASLQLSVEDALCMHPESVSHPLQVRARGESTEVTLGSGNRAPLDRDLVVRWSVTDTSFASTIDTSAHDGRAFALLTVVPPSLSAQPRRVPRDLTLLLDTSGSMQGEPLAQEKRIACALIDALGEIDTLEVIEFSSHTRAFKKSAERVDTKLKQQAIQWVQALSANGGTEMVSGVQAAMRELREGSQRQIVLITDGLVGFESQLVNTVLGGLPKSARMHVVGVGSAVNRAMVAPIARAGRGAEIVVGLGEDAEPACDRLLACTSAPLVIDLEIRGSALRGDAPRVADIFANAPLRMALEVAPEGGELVLSGKTSQGRYEHRMQIAHISERRASVDKLFAREYVEEREMRISSGHGDNAALERDIELAGVEFQIATRLTSWVAVTDAVTVDPRDPSKHVEQPQQLPYGMSAAGLGLREPAGMMFGAAPGGAASLGALPVQSSPMPRAARAAMRVPPSPAAPPPPAGAPRAREESTPFKLRERMESTPTDERADTPPRAESAAAAPAAKKGKSGESFFARAKRWISGEKTTTGTVSINDAERLVLSFSIQGALAWHEWTFTAILDDGSAITLRLRIDESTHEGARDVIVRAVCDALPDPTRLVAIEAHGPQQTVRAEV